MSKTKASQSGREPGRATAGNTGSSPNKIIVVGITAALAFAIGGWIAWNSWQSARGLDTKPADTLGAGPGQIAPDFSVPTLDGGMFNLAAQRGKPTIIFFMAYWCGTCIPESRALARLKQEYREQLSIVAIDLDPSSTPEALNEFKQIAGNGAYTWAFDGDQKVTRAYQVRALDTTLVLDRDGRVVYRDYYPTPYETLKEALVELGL